MSNSYLRCPYWREALDTSRSQWRRFKPLLSRRRNSTNERWRRRRGHHLERPDGSKGRHIPTSDIRPMEHWLGWRRKVLFHNRESQVIEALGGFIRHT